MKTAHLFRALNFVIVIYMMDVDMFIVIFFIKLERQDSRLVILNLMIVVIW